MKSAGSLEQRRGLGETPLLQPDGADQRRQRVIHPTGQQGLHGCLCARQIAGLQQLPTPGDGMIDIQSHDFGAFCGQIRVKDMAGPSLCASLAGISCVSPRPK
jgi:hypothetical protein